MSFSETKEKVRDCINKMLQQENISLHEVFYERTHGMRLDLRQRICAFAWEALQHGMSEGEVAKFLGTTRTGFMASRMKFNELHQE